MPRVWLNISKAITFHTLAELPRSMVAAQLRAVGSTFLSTFLTTMMAIVVVIYSVRNTDHLGIVVASAAILTAINCGTLYHCWLHERRDWCIDDSKSAQRNLCFQAGLTAFGWYLLLGVADFSGNGINRDLLDCIMAGVLAAGALRYAAVPSASIVFVITGLFSIFVYATLAHLPFELVILLGLFTILLIKSVLSQARLFLENQQAANRLIDAAIDREQQRAAADQAVLERTRLTLDVRQRSARDRAIELDRFATEFERSVVDLVADLGGRAQTGDLAARALSTLMERSVGTSTALLSQVRQTTSGNDILLDCAQALHTELQDLKAKVGEQTLATQRVQSSFLDNKNATARLNDRAREVAKIVDLIASIAARTNLLALNASIEAARAGEFGRGFSVVAQEVKALAAQTRSATDAVSQQVEMIMAVVREVTGSLTVIHDGFGSVHRLAESLDKTMTGQQALMGSLSDRADKAASVNAALDNAASEAAAMSDQANSLSNDLSRASADVVERSSSVLIATSRFTEGLRKVPNLEVA